MIPLYTQNEYNLAKTNDLLLVECEFCHKPFNKKKTDIQQSFNLNGKNKCNYCSNYCTGKAKIIKIKLNCTNCNKEIEKAPNELRKSKSGNHFCSKSCTSTFNSKHKTHGTSRSKLEVWLEEQLIKIYPTLDIKFNDRTKIGIELDLYIPSLNIAFELNGIFHYEPIFGIDTLNRMQLKDISKSKLCYENKIDLCVIDTSQQKYFKPTTSQKYLDIIINIINERLLTS